MKKAMPFIMLLGVFVVVYLIMSNLISVPKNMKEARKNKDFVAMTKLNDLIGLDKFLIRASADTVSADGKHLLYIAAGKEGGMNVLRLLTERDASIDKTYQSRTALMNAALHCKYQEVLFLINNDADANIIDSNDQKASDLVGEGDDKEKIIKLLKQAEEKQY